jgi:hypothetical protein
VADEKVYDFPTNRPRSEAAKLRANVKESALKALADPRGGANEAFFIMLKVTKPEAFATFLKSLVPIEVQGDASITVRVVTQLGAAQEVDVTRAKKVDAPLPSLPVVVNPSDG